MKSAVLAGLASLLLVACADDKQPVDDVNALPRSNADVAGAAPDAAVDASAGRVRLIHLSTDAGPVDVYMDGDPNAIVSDLRFLNGTAYLSVPAGDHRFDLAPAGAGIENVGLSVDLEVIAGTDYTAAAYGSLANETLAILPIVDDRSEVEGMRFQIAHVADRIEQVDLFEMETMSPILSDLGFGEIRTLDGPAGALRVGIDLDDDMNTQDYAFSVPALESDGMFVNVFAVNSRSMGVLLAAQLTDGEVSVVRYDPRIRVLHASPAAPEVDLLFGGMMPPAVTNLTFGEGSPYLIVEAGTYDFQVFVTGQGGMGAPALQFDGNLLAGRSYTAVAYGETPRAAIIVDRLDRLDAGDIRFKILHGAQGAGAVNLVNADTGEVLLNNLSEDDIDQFDLPMGGYSFGLDLGMDGTVDAMFDIPELGANLLVDVAVVLDGDRPRLVAHLPDGTGMVIDPR